MSTTVTITPVAAGAAGAGLAIVPLAVAAAGIWAAAHALARADKACQELIQKSREERRRERLAAVQLRSTDLERLARSASEARFLKRALVGQALRFDSSRDAGAAVWATRTPEGITVIGEERALRHLLVANTTSRVVEYLESQGYRVEACREGPGAVNLVASTGGPRRVSLKVESSGDVQVDVQNHVGPGCDDVVRGLAAAVDGTITTYSRKPEYFGSAPIKLGGKQNV